MECIFCLHIIYYKLSTDCVIDNSDMFKNNVDTYISRADYTKMKTMLDSR